MDPKIASERGRKSAEEFQKLLVVTSLGALGLFFGVLSKDVEPSLTIYQKFISIFAVSLLSTSSAIGMYSWYIDAKVNLIWSFALSEQDKDKQKELYKTRSKLKKFEKVLNIIFFSSYAAGMLMGTTFLVLRIVNI